MDLGNRIRLLVFDRREYKPIIEGWHRGASGMINGIDNYRSEDHEFEFERV